MNRTKNPLTGKYKQKLIHRFSDVPPGFVESWHYPKEYNLHYPAREGMIESVKLSKTEGVKRGHLFVNPPTVEAWLAQRKAAAEEKARNAATAPMVPQKANQIPMPLETIKPGAQIPKAAASTDDAREQERRCVPGTNTCWIELGR